QITWLRAMPERIVVDCIAPDATARALDALERVLDGGTPA
ncbi:TPA: tRNA (adenosine(37)-N6)-dimethylallyltransferase MiaA, partial [Burkholderia cepacia]